MLSRTLPRRCLSSTQHLRALRIPSQPLPSQPPTHLHPPTRIEHTSSRPAPRRLFATTPGRRADFDPALVDQKMEEITDLSGPPLPALSQPPYLH
ncbi:uncharacterized protein BDZ99DRAFT_458751 [Mytilinidion resinicola]|uniref:Uncharacterized protein n=1 Tax=Mytilinidion resinicola TaxID=574789 RepID=A0A6A6Z3N0_9PEZI|nr:uncharacterized protein BDZ99DRAFT_458751 [Mytilinidion resinicola]KAF2814765.1 hypothetical protein BDZ99DRAFT_458751 [Mytilinidion resinicola]